MRRSRIHPESILTLLIALAAAYLLSPVLSAEAATSNCGSPQYLFTGRLYNPTSGTVRVRGATAYIETKQANLCTSIFTDVSAWSMVAADNVLGYAQIGYLHQSSGSAPWRLFWEWTEYGQITYQRYWGSPAIGEQHEYRVSRYDTDGKLHMILDGAQAGCNAKAPPFDACAQTDFDPTVSWSGLQNQWFGETHAPGSDTPGTVGAEADFFAVQTRDQNGVWSARGFTGGANGSKCYYHYFTPSNQNFEIWTAPLDHDC